MYIYALLLRFITIFVAAFRLDRTVTETDRMTGVCVREREKE